MNANNNSNQQDSVNSLLDGFHAVYGSAEKAPREHHEVEDGFVIFNDSGIVETENQRFLKEEILALKEKGHSNAEMLHESFAAIDRTLDHIEMKTVRVYQKMQRDIEILQSLENQHKKDVVWAILKVLFFVGFTIGSWYLTKPLLDQVFGSFEAFQQNLEETANKEGFDSTNVLHDVLFHSEKAVDVQQERFEEQGSKIDDIIDG